MNCRKVSHLLSAYIDGELPGVEHRLIHEHLTRCGECAEEYAGLLEMKRMLGRLRVQEPGVQLPARILQQVDAEYARHSQNGLHTWLRRFSTLLHQPVPAPYGAALGAGALVLGMLVTTHTPAPRDKFTWTAASADSITSLASPDARNSAESLLHEAAPLPVISVPEWPGRPRMTPGFPQPAQVDFETPPIYFSPRQIQNPSNSH